MPRLIGLSIVLLLHGVILWALGQQRLMPDAQQTQALFVDFILPPAPEKPMALPPAPEKPMAPASQAVKSLPRASPAPRLATAVAAVVQPSDELAPLPALPRSEAPANEAPRSEGPSTPAPLPAPAMPLPAEPLTLSGELAVFCPERPAPIYPALARRLGEEGTVLLRVELDETGAVAQAHIQMSSGFARLDDAALAAVKSWRCQPAQRHGQTVRAAALQPFKFVLQ